MHRLVAAGRRALSRGAKSGRTGGVEEGLGVHVVDRVERADHAADASAMQDYAQVYTDMASVRRMVEREGLGTASTRRERNSGLPKSVLEDVTQKDKWFSPGGRQKTVQNYNKLIRALGAQGKVTQALEALHEMQAKSGLKPSEFTLTAAIWACGKARDSDALGHVVELAKKSYLATDVKAFVPRLGRILRTAIASAYLQCGKRSEAMMYLKGDVSILNGHYYLGPGNEDLEKIADDANVVTWTALIKDHVDRGDHSFARRAMEVMRIRGVEPDLVTFNVMISSAARNREINRALALMNEMRAMGYQPDAVTYTSLAHGYANKGDPLAARQILRQAKADGLLYNQDMANVLLHAYAQIGDYVNAERVFEDLVKTFEVGYDLTIGCTSLMAAYARHLRHLHAPGKKNYPTEKKGIHPNLFTAEHDLNDRADKLFADMKSLRLLFDTQLLNNYLLVKTASRRLQRIQEATKIVHDEFGSTLVGEGDEDNPECQKPNADIFTYSILIRSHGEAGDPDGALSVLRKMRNDGVAPDGYLLLQAARACAVGAMFNEALDIIVQANSQGVKFDGEGRSERPLRALLGLFRRADQRRIESICRRVLMEEHQIDLGLLESKYPQRNSVAGDSARRRSLPSTLRGIKWWS